MKHAIYALSLCALLSCGDKDPEPPKTESSTFASPGGAAESNASSQSVVAHRDKVAALFSEDRFEDCAAMLAPRAQRETPDPWDLSAYGIVLNELGRRERAQELFERAAELDPTSPVPPFNLGRLFEAEPERSLTYLRQALERAPDDLPTKLAVARNLRDLDRLDESMAMFTALQAIGLDYSGSWYMTITYQRSQVAYDLMQDELAMELSDEYEALQARGIKVPESDDIRRGNFGRILPPKPLAQAAKAPGQAIVYGPARALGFDPDLTILGLVAGSLKDVWVPTEDEASFGTLTPTGWIAFGEFGARGMFDEEERLICEQPVSRALPLDIDNDGDLDLLTVHAQTVTLHLKEPIDWEARDVYVAPSRITDAVLVDFDHENDLDLLLVGDFGVRLLRNDAAEDVAGAYTDVTQEAGLTTTEPLDWCVVEDFDTDQDVDLMWGGAVGVQLGDNLRGGHFQMLPERTRNLPIGPEPLIGDLDLDGRPDLVFGERGTFLVRADNTYKKRDDGVQGVPLADFSWPVADLDLNGDRDGLGRAQDGSLIAYGGLVHTLPVQLEGDQPLPAFEQLGGLADVDGDGVEDLVVVRAGKAEFHRRLASDASGLTLFLHGVKDNRRGRGSIVEVRVGESYQRMYWTGERARIELHGAPYADVVRITWPNGVVQSLVEQPPGVPLTVKQKPGLIGSCPFLYSWNGERYVFVSDVLGITPLGLPMAPGMLVPPDHDEFVLVTGKQLGVREHAGKRTYDLQFTEELREVTYLDKARLLVVDHPIGTEIFPDERFCFPPFAGGDTLTTRAPLGPLSAREVDMTTGKADGRDWAAELAAIDSDYAAPFEHYVGRFQGLAKPHMIELAFDGDAVAQAQELRLFLTGWFFWTNASVNMAAARTPGVDFVPPIFSVPDGQGGWRELGPPYGFPAGKTKTMALDLTGVLDPADPRLRIFSTLRLYWDAIRLGTQGEDTPLVVTELAPITADLWERGFSKPVPMLGDESSEWFDWDQVELTPRWNQHPGKYTRFGDVLPLLDQAEDQYIIMGSGDALHLSFDADQVPELPAGWRRDFLVYLDGWAKDRDPNSVGVEFVEPMPFHGMSGFPYPEPFPDTDALRAWRAEWNTREGKMWIEPLAPNR